MKLSANQLTLKWEDYPGLFNWAKYIIIFLGLSKNPYQWKRKAKEKEPRDGIVVDLQLNVAGSANGRTGP